MVEAIDNGDDAFFDKNGDETIRDCFKGVLAKNIGKTNLMPGRFRVIAQNILGAAFQWPVLNRFGNSFKWLYKQYITNVKNNLNTHCESRLKKFFKMRVYELNAMIRNGMLDMPWFNGSDVTNAVKWAYHRKDHTRDDAIAKHKMEILLEQLYDVGAPDTPDDPFNIRSYTHLHWFKSLRMWCGIMYEINHFHARYADLNRRWNEHKVSVLNQNQYDLNNVISDLFCFVLFSCS